jgi:conjugal transfer/type IV secretion protein DotA/TraY
MNKKLTPARVINAVPWLLLTAVILSVLPLQAHAAIGFNTANLCADKSIRDVLTPLFGSLFSNCGGSAGAFEAAVGILNAGALTIGGILAAYTLVAGTMQTAHDGEMLGKKWSSMWLPIRTVMGVGLVLPVSGTYCVAQMIVAFLISQGVLFANTIWTTYVEKMTTPAGMAPKARLPKVDDLARQILASQVCMEAYNEIRKGGGTASTAVMDGDMAASSPSDGIRNYGLKGGKQCGYVMFDKTPLTPDAAFTGSPMSYDPTPLSAVESAHIAAVSAMEVEQLRPAAQAIVAARETGSALPDLNAVMNKAVTNYQTSVATSANSVFGNPNALAALKKSATDDGWYMAGAWFLKAVQMQDAVSKVATHVPTAGSPDVKALGYVSNDLANYFRVMEVNLREAAQNSSNTALGNQSTFQVIDGIGNSSNPFQKGVQAVMNTIMGGDWIAAMAKGDPNRSQLMIMKDFGDYLMTGSEAGIGIGIASVSAGKAAENGTANSTVLNTLSFGAVAAGGGAVAGALQTVGYLLIFACVSMFGLAAAIAVYLPLAPFLLYFGAFLGWLILCGEAVIAAPLWAIMHLSPSGDDMMGGARQGYMLLLGLLLRPALIVLGFVFAIAGVEIVAGIFNNVFFPAFKLAMAGSVIGLGTSFAMVAIYFGSMVWIFHQAFGLIHVIPDKLLRWIGGGGEQLGESAKGLARTGESGAGAVGKHVNTAQDNVVRGMIASSAINAAKKGRADDAGREAGNQEMQMKEAGNQAAVENAKADAPKAKMEEKLGSVASDLNAASKISDATRAMQKSDQLNGTKTAAPFAEANKDRQDQFIKSAEGRAQSMAGEAKDSVADSVSRPGDMNARQEANSKLKGAAHAYEMLAQHMESNGDQKQASAYRDQAQQLRNEVKANPDSIPESDGGDGSGA